MVYNNYTPIFNQLQNINPDFQGIGALDWQNIQTPHDFAGRVITLKKGREKERLTALAQYIQQQGLSDPTLTNLANFLINQADSLQAPAEATRKKTHKTYKKTKKHASKSHKKSKPHAHAKKHVSKKKKAKPVKKSHAKKHIKKQKKVKHTSKHSKKHTHHHKHSGYKYTYSYTPPTYRYTFPFIPSPSIHFPFEEIAAPAPAPAPFTPSSYQESAAPAPVSNAFTNAFANYEITPNHMRHTFSGTALPTINPLPTAPDFNLNTYLGDIISYISPSWPNDLKVKDDTIERTKEEILSRIRERINELHLDRLYNASAENRALLRRMYGNIFFVIRTQIRNISALTTQQKNAFDRKVRSFIQSLGTTFHHCSDRLMTDSARYYFQFVENRIHGIENDETLAIDEKLHRELVPLRRIVFQEAYHSVDTNCHDAATQRHVQHELNVELGLHMPPFNEDDNYASFALREKVVEVNVAFYQRYTPARIAQYLSTTIKTAIEEHGQGRAKQNWYTLITTYLQNKHPSLNISTIYDLDTNSFTANGIAMLLTDLNIIKNKG